MISNAQVCIMHVVLKIATWKGMDDFMEDMGMSHDYRFVLYNLSKTSPQWTLPTTISNARTRKRVSKVG